MPVTLQRFRHGAFGFRHVEAIASVMLADFLKFEWQQVLARPAQHRCRPSRDSSNVKRASVANQYVWLISASIDSDPPLPLHGAAPAPFALPDSLHSAPAGARTETLVRRSPLPNESLVAARPVATVVEKNLG